MKTLRFSQLIKTSGRPQPATIWGDPAKDLSFTRAIRENRVLTVTQRPASKKADAGKIGFHPQPQAAYFVFPKPLPPSDDIEVVGIKYDLLEEGIVVGQPVASKKAKEPPKPEPPKPKRFAVIVRRVAVVETKISLEAADPAQAKEQAIKLAEREPFDLTEAVTTTQVRLVEPEP